jgi:hypothetical protein
VSEKNPGLTQRAFTTMAGASSGGQAGPAEDLIPLLEQLRLEPPTNDVEVRARRLPPVAFLYAIYV